MDNKSDDRILVVDDDATSRKLLVRTLSSAGYDCYESDNGAETLKLVHSEQPSLPGGEVAACYRPVIQVGGDIYGWLRVRDGRILFWIADATGHGASAALLTALAKLLFHHGSVEHDAPAAIMQAVNTDFRNIFGARSFMTAMCVALDPASGRANVVGAGHPPLLVARHDGGTDAIASSAPPLGLVERARFIETIVDLRRGDAFVLYTDGLFGAANGEKPRLTPEDLAKMIDLSAPSAEALLMSMMNQATPADGEHPLPDDVAAVAIRRTA